MSKKVLLFGTNNAHKLREIQEMVGAIFAIKSLRDLGLDIDVEETEATLEGNALLKAQSFFERTGLPCFADDTGLEVEALGGAPGVYTARYAGDHCSPADNIQKMLREMKGQKHRRARFRTVIAFFDGGQSRFFEGEVWGNITRTASGEGGFGYDPIFQPEGYDKTFASLSPEEKHAISHRGIAVRRFADFLKASY